MNHDQADKKPTPKLALKSEKLRTLTAEQLRSVVGGVSTTGKRPETIKSK